MMVFWTLLPLREMCLFGVSEEGVASIVRVTGRCKNSEYGHLNIKMLRNSHRNGKNCSLLMRFEQQEN